MPRVTRILALGLGFLASACTGDESTEVDEPALPPAPPLPLDDQEVEFGGKNLLGSSLSDPLFATPFTLPSDADVLFKVRDNYLSTANGWNMAIVPRESIEAFRGCQDADCPDADPRGFFSGNGSHAAAVSLTAGDYALVVKCTNSLSSCRLSAQVDVLGPAPAGDVSGVWTTGNEWLSDDGSIAVTQTGSAFEFTFQLDGTNDEVVNGEVVADGQLDLDLATNCCSGTLPDANTIVWSSDDSSFGFWTRQP